MQTIRRLPRGNMSWIIQIIKIIQMTNVSAVEHLDHDVGMVCMICGWSVDDLPEIWKRSKFSRVRLPNNYYRVEYKAASLGSAGTPGTQRVAVCRNPHFSFNRKTTKKRPPQKNKLRHPSPPPPPPLTFLRTPCRLRSSRAPRSRTWLARCPFLYMFFFVFSRGKHTAHTVHGTRSVVHGVQAKAVALLSRAFHGGKYRRNTYYGGPK